MRTEIDKGNENGAEMEVPTFVNEASSDSSLTRADLEKKTGKQLAKLAHPLQKGNKVSLKTLEGKSKTYLIDIILGIEEEKEQTSKGRAPQNQSESADILDVALNVLHGIKMQREGEKASLNPIAAELFKNSAVNEVDKARAEGTLQTDKFNTLILCASGTALVVDGVIGFKNIPTLFNKLKSKLTKKV